MPTTHGIAALAMRRSRAGVVEPVTPPIVADHARLRIGLRNEVTRVLILEMDVRCAI